MKTTEGTATQDENAYQDNHNSCLIVIHDMYHAIEDMVAALKSGNSDAISAAQSALEDCITMDTPYVISKEQREKLKSCPVGLLSDAPF